MFFLWPGVLCFVYVRQVPLDAGVIPNAGTVVFVKRYFTYTGRDLRIRRSEGNGWKIDANCSRLG